MVARKQPLKSGMRDALSRLKRTSHAWFLTWRLMLTRVLRLPKEILGRLRYQPRPSLVISFFKTPEETLASEAGAPVRLSALGVRAFIAGALIYAMASVIGGTDTAVAFTRLLSAVGWAIARLGIMFFYCRRDPAERSAVATGWAIGLLPYVFGATAGLRVIAFLASAIYTDAALSGVGIEREQARSLTLRAFGIQAIVVTVMWGFRALAALLIVLGASL